MKMEIRCECGKLLAKMEGEYLILQCRRCKRQYKIKVEKDAKALKSKPKDGIIEQTF